MDVVVAGVGRGRAPPAGSGRIRRGAAGGAVEPEPADGGRADERGGEADAEEDLDEKVIIVKHLGYGRPRRRLPLAFHVLLRWFLSVGLERRMNRSRDLYVWVSVGLGSILFLGREM